MITDQLLKKYPIISDQVDARELRVVLMELEKKLVAGNTGAVVEFGCYVGTTSLFIMRLLSKYNSSNQYHVFDSFSGLPDKTRNDYSAAGEQFKTGELLATKKEFITNFKKAGLPIPVIHKGWFSDISPRDIPAPVAFAFLDGDYYQSVKDSFALITPVLAKGAVIIVDDYVSDALPGAAKATNEWLNARHWRMQTAASLAVITAPLWYLLCIRSILQPYNSGMRIPSIQLTDGNTIPQIGLGLWQVTDKGEFDRMFHSALQAGYRHFDSAQVYNNETMLGQAWHESGIAREKLFLTTKIAVQNFGEKHAAASFEKSLQYLQTDYVDLLLLHFPVTLLRQGSWRVMEALKTEGKAKSIGVSNYTVRHLKEMEKYTQTIPAVNQVELHVFLQQPELLKYCKQKNITVEAYSPLAHAENMDSPVLRKIAAKHKKSYAQIMLRWCVQVGTVVLPKSVTPERVRENIDIFNFELDRADMTSIKALDIQQRTCWDPSLVP